MLRLLNSIIGFAVLLYPLAVYFGVQVMSPWKISAALMAMLILRFSLFPADRQWGRTLIGIGILYCAFAIWDNSVLSLRFYPVGVSVCLFLLFSLSLLYPPPVIERLARLQHPDLSSQAVNYTRKVTQIWCVFFVVNASIAAGTALWANFFWWSLYNGFIAYVLIGLLMGIEYAVRIKMQLHEH
jgi:uncharacterized membrane protein